MTALTDAEEFYPSVRLKSVLKTTKCFSQHLPEEDQINIKHCLCLIKFGIQSTALVFVDKCCECDCDRIPEQKGLTTGACESAS